MKNLHSTDLDKISATTPLKFHEIYDFIQKNEDFSQGELHLLRRAIERKLRTGILRLDVEDLNLKPYSDCQNNVPIAVVF